MKQLNASIGVLTIGSPLTLKEEFEKAKKRFLIKGRSVARCPGLCLNNPYISTFSNNQIT